MCQKCRYDVVMPKDVVGRAIMRLPAQLLEEILPSMIRMRSYQSVLDMGTGTAC